MPNPIQSANTRAINAARQESRMTPRMKRFVKEFAADPSNATAAAIKAGYSPRSAKVTASRLLQNAQIQSILGDHFTDSQDLISKILVDSLKRIEKIVADGSNKDAVKAIGQGFNYARLAASVLGLQVIPGKAESPLSGDLMTLDETIEALERELDKLRALRSTSQSRDGEAAEEASTAGAVH